MSVGAADLIRHSGCGRTWSRGQNLARLQSVGTPRLCRQTALRPGRWKRAACR